MSMVIGIDIVDCTRFERSSHLKKFISRFDVDGENTRDVAKTWACLEAIIKAESHAFDPTDIKIKFPNNSAPLVVDNNCVLKHSYQLSVSHERSLVIAVALGTLKVD
jgi:phosphopantetheinyl transferase (holo-ACP synthase)